MSYFRLPYHTQQFNVTQPFPIHFLKTFNIMSDNIPLDVQLDIRNRLPIKTIVMLRRVSKIWKANIDSQPFITSYGARHTDECLFNLTFDQGYKGFMAYVYEKLIITLLDSHLQLTAMRPVGNSCGLTCFMYGTTMMVVI